MTPKQIHEAAEIRAKTEYGEPNALKLHPEYETGFHAGAVYVLSRLLHSTDKGIVRELAEYHFTIRPVDTLGDMP